MRLEMKSIVMEFGPVRAVDNVDLTIEPGQIVGLLGENGAGKSTLMNVLAGVYTPVSGKILINGNETTMRGVRTANQCGIRFIHQELNLCKDLRVYENMFLGEEIPKGPIFLDKETMVKKCADVFQRMKVSIDPEAVVETLSAAEKQLVEIGKALLFQSELIIMDEPSTALATAEIENLFDIMRQLKKEGVSFIYISHKMPELFEICDIYYILCDGKLIAHGNFKDIDEDQVTELMIGHNLQSGEFENHVCRATEEVCLSVRGVSSGVLKDISFDLHRGEILAVTGLQGSGRDTLADVLFGVQPYTGEIEVEGVRMPSNANDRSVRYFMKHRVGMVPRMRAERGIHNDLSVQDNLSMGFLNAKFKNLFISAKEERARFERQQKAMSIKVGNTRNPITSLSGGNQQKVILGKWLETDADVLLLDNPTQGIDVGTKFEIYHLILRLAEAGKAIIMFSAEFPEIRKVADSCIVLYKGSCNAWLNRDELTEKNVMYYSTGANLEGLKDGKKTDR
ncbi:MAG: sugar ABC transporter ATP-binding protein [Dysosmobacter sp.]|jgi:ABC-type sugar transport system ATPase subunit|uniref:sugar ABC transporter ATP-binding protein n=1 Tax=Dysosmobacter sp. TaxID=2591382 RepID=UPI003D912BD1